MLARQVVIPLLSGDKAAALTILREVGDASFISGAMEQQVDAPLARMPKDTFTIRGYTTGLGADVIVELTNGKGGEDANVVVRCLTSDDEFLASHARGRVLRNIDGLVEPHFDWDWLTGDRSGGQSSDIESPEA